MIGSPEKPELSIQNLDVPETSQGQDVEAAQGSARLTPSEPPLYSLGASTAQPDQQQKHRRQYRAGGTKYITVPQATNIIEAVEYAKSISLPLVAHLTIHWAYTDVGDDPDGKLFSKVREGLDKWLKRHGIVFAGAWCVERMSRGQADVVHCHLLFHLPLEYRTKRKLQVEAAIYRLIKRHGKGYWAEKVIDLRIHDNPDGKYLIKGGGPKVWKLFRLRKEHRRLQGVIYGKRCGTTENVGRAARQRAAAAGSPAKRQRGA
jgi:hypothetical protein